MKTNDRKYEAADYWALLAVREWPESYMEKEKKKLKTNSETYTFVSFFPVSRENKIEIHEICMLGLIKKEEEES